jgi:hypothetical protein
MPASCLSRTSIPLLLLGAMAGCSSGDSGTGNLGSTHIDATIDGVAFTGSAASVTVGATASSGATYQISATDATQSANGLTLTLYNIKVPGTYPLGVGPSVFGGSATVNVGGIVAATPLSGAAGTVTVDVETPSRLAGTFSFAAVGAGGSHSVTQGDFDLAVHGTSSPIVDSVGGMLAGTVGGQAWTAATVAAQLTGATADTHVLSIQASNTTYRVEFVLPGVDAAGVFSVPGPALRIVRATAVTDPTRVWGGTVSLSAGAFGVDSVTANRIAGSFSMTLLPAPGNPSNTSLDISGSFDLGLSH